MMSVPLICDLAWVAPVWLLAKTLKNTSFLVVRFSCHGSVFALTAVVAAVYFVRAVLSAEHSSVPTGSEKEGSYPCAKLEDSDTLLCRNYPHCF